MLKNKNINMVQAFNRPVGRPSDPEKNKAIYCQYKKHLKGGIPIMEAKNMLAKEYGYHFQSIHRIVLKQHDIETQRRLKGTSKSPIRALLRVFASLF